MDNSSEINQQWNKDEKFQWQPLSSNADTFQRMSVAKIDDQSNFNPEDLRERELEALLAYMDQSNDSVRAENDLLENYLATMDPTLIENMEGLLDAATAAIHKAERTVQLGMMAAASSRSQTSPMGQESYSSSPRSSSQTLASSRVAAFTLADNKGPKIQPSQKMEIIQREMDCIRASYEENKGKFDKKSFEIECEKEAMLIEIKELAQLYKTYNECVSKTWIDETTHTIPGEKIIAYFLGRQKHEEQQIKALLTKRKNIKIQLDVVNNKIMELGDELKYVDYERLKILDYQVKSDLEITLRKLSELKKTNTINLSNLNRTRKEISRNMESAANFEKAADDLERRIEGLLKEEVEVKQELCLRQEKIERLIEFQKQYEAPTVMSYARSKDELERMKTALEATERRARIAEISNTNSICQTTKLCRAEFARKTQK